MIKFLDLAKQYASIKPEIDQAIADVIADTAFVAGKYAKRFEAEFADRPWVKWEPIPAGKAAAELRAELDALGYAGENE